MSKALDLVIEKNQKNIDAAVSSMNVFRQQIQRAASHLETLVNYRHECQASIQQKASSQGVRSRELLNQHSFITQVDKAISQQLNHSKACQSFFIEAQQKAKIEMVKGIKFKTARKIMHKKQLTLANRREQKLNDEISANLISQRKDTQDD